MNTGIRISDEAVQRALDYLKDKAPERAAARAARLYMEKQVKVVWADVFMSADAKTVADKEAIAESSMAYRDALKEYRQAIEQDEKCREYANAAQILIELYRTEQANNRKGL